jgi:hypothetical protein
MLRPVARATRASGTLRITKNKRGENFPNEKAIYISLAWAIFFCSPQRIGFILAVVSPALHGQGFEQSTKGGGK